MTTTSPLPRSAARLPESALDALRSRVRGPITCPGDADYDVRRAVWNGMIDRSPGAVLRCTGAADVLAAVRVAAEHDLQLSVRGGGHNVAGLAVCDGGLTIDLSGMRGVRAVLIVFYPVDRAPEVVEAFRDHMAEAPDELMALAIFWSAPHDDSIPEAARGSDVVAVAGCWCGPMDQGERAIAPLRSLAPPIADLSGPMPFLAAQRLFDPEYPDGRRYYWKSTWLGDLGPDVASFLIEHSARRPSPISSVDVWALGGAFARAEPGATAFFQRSAPFLLGVEGNWDDRSADAANVAWARAMCDAASRWSPGGGYFNFPGLLEEGEAMLEQSFGANYERLRRVKARYDPGDRFRNSLRIPAGV